MGYSGDWHEANQRFLVASLDLIKARLKSGLDGDVDDGYIKRLQLQIEDAKKELPSARTCCAPCPKRSIVMWTGPQKSLIISETSGANPM